MRALCPFLVLCVVGLLPVCRVKADTGDLFLPAFPGAEGFGARTTGGRGGRVIAVTNLNDSGPGSLRAALSESGPRTVIFRVSGNIALNSNISLKNGDVTIAGQTAPGDGICLTRRSFALSGASNVIIRHLRFRPGDVAGVELDSFEGREGENIIIDHCSASWSIDECLSVYGAIKNVTVQWCLIAESLYESVHSKGAHGYGGIWGGDGASFHHNLLAHHSSRNPRIGGGADCRLADLRNNVIYNWGFNSTYGGDGDVRVNQINNVYKPGPATRAGVRSRLTNPSLGTTGRSLWWLEGNLAVGSPEVSADNWLGVQPSGGVAVSEFRAPGAFSVAPVTTQTAEEAYTLVLEHAGATLPKRDTLDARVVQETRTGTATYGGTFDGGGNGIINSQTAVGGWPELQSVAAPADADGDGMPDSWEQSHGLNSANAADGPQDKDGDGYTNLEEYLNDTDPGVYVDYRIRGSSGDPVISFNHATNLDQDLGESTELSVTVSGGTSVSYQWQFLKSEGWVNIDGATASSYSIFSTQRFHGGSYRVVVSSGGAVYASETLVLRLKEAPVSTARFEALSARAPCETGDRLLILGLVLEGAGSKSTLVRSGGSVLPEDLQSQVISNPVFSLKKYDMVSKTWADQGQNDNWGEADNAAEIAQASARAGFQPFPAGSRDCAMLLRLSAGSYSGLTSVGTGTPGIVLTEFIDLMEDLGSSRLKGISCRGFAGSGAQTMIVGFVIKGDTARTILIRGIGPGLAGQNIPSAVLMPDPKLVLFRYEAGSGNRVILENDNWGDYQDRAFTHTVSQQLGFDVLPDGSSDAVLAATLKPGIYTVHITPASGATGVALLELYEAP